MKTKRVSIKGKIFEAEICESPFSKFRGLMFRKQPKPLLFLFDGPTRLSIHSFFCKPFRAVWLNKNKIIDDKIVVPYCFSVKPKEEFTSLLEIPLNKCESPGVSDENRKI